MLATTPTAGFSKTEGETTISNEAFSQGFQHIEKLCVFHAY